LSVFALVSIGCSDDPAAVRVIHASADAPTLDVYLKPSSGNPATVFSALAWAGVSPYQQVKDEDDYVFELRQAGAGATDMPLGTSSSWHLSHGESVTAVVAGLASTGDTSAALQVLVQPESFNLPSDNVWVMMVNAIPDVPDCDIKVGSVDTGTLTRFTAVEAEVPGGMPATFALSSTSGLAPVATSFTTTLTSPHSAFAVALGISSLDPGDDHSLSLLVAGTDGATMLVRQDPLVYALHAMPDAPPVDLYNATSEVASALAFGSLSSAIQLLPGDQTLDVFAHSAANARPGGDPLGSITLTGLAGGHSYLAVASGFIGRGRSPGFTAGSWTQAFATSPDAALLRIVQASPDLGKVTIGTDDTTFTPIPDFSNLAFMSASPEAGTPTGGSSLLGVEASGATSVSQTFPITVTAGQSAFGVLAGALAGKTTDQPLQLIQIVTNSGWAASAIPATPPTTH
jgi:hypothetical protein